MSAVWTLMWALACPSKDVSVDTGEPPAVELEPTGTLTGLTALGVDVEGGLAFVAAFDAGLVLVDAQDPTAPAILGTVGMAGEAFDVDADGVLVAVAAWEAGLQVVYVADPSAPAVVASVVTPAPARSVALRDNIAYICTWSGNTAGDDPANGLLIYDIADWASPVLLGSLPTPGWCTDVVVGGTQAYVADGPGGVQFFDITDPAAASLVANLPTEHGAVGVAWAYPDLHVAEQTGGLRRIDVSNVTGPVDVERFDVNGLVLGTAADGSAMWAVGEGVVAALDSTRTDPIAGTGVLPGAGWAAALTESHAWIAASDGGLLTYARLD